jgi:phosphopantetheine--protein transferase-like protein
VLVWHRGGTSTAVPRCADARTSLRSSDVGARLGRVSAPGAWADVWFAWVGDHARDVERFSREFLSREELDRLHLYRSPGAAERYVLTRSLVRIVLGDHLGEAPRDVRVGRTEMGKPVISGADHVHFNVSHSGELILLALCGTRPVGVDVERRREVARVQKLVERWLTDSERLEMAEHTVRGTGASEAFLRIWSLKEARLKALGVGISGAGSAALDTVEALSLDQLLETLPSRPDEPGYVGALAFA